MDRGDVGKEEGAEMEDKQGSEAEVAENNAKSLASTGLTPPNT